LWRAVSRAGNSNWTWISSSGASPKQRNTVGGEALTPSFAALSGAKATGCRD